MKTSRCSETQVFAILKQGDAGINVKDLCRADGSSDATDDNWNAKYGELEVSDFNRLKETKRELVKPKRMYADLAPRESSLKGFAQKKRLSCRLRNGRR